MADEDLLGINYIFVALPRKTRKLVIPSHLRGKRWFKLAPGMFAVRVGCFESISLNGSNGIEQDGSQIVFYDPPTSLNELLLVD